MFIISTISTITGAMSVAMTMMMMMVMKMVMMMMAMPMPSNYYLHAGYYEYYSIVPISVFISVRL